MYAIIAMYTTLTKGGSILSEMAITVAEAAELLKIHKTTVIRLFHSGDLKGYRRTKGGPIMLYVDSVKRYIEEAQGRPVPVALKAR